jgi:uncharacterized protein YjbJ (UPF0337 family)
MRNKDEVKGKDKQIEGAMKAEVGEVTNNPSLEVEGEDERREEKVQEKIGKVRRKVGNVVAKVSKALGGK